MIEKIKGMGNWTIGLIAAGVAAIIGFIVWCLSCKK